MSAEKFSNKCEKCKGECYYERKLHDLSFSE